MGIWKKLISGFLAMVMLFSMLPMQVFAAEDEPAPEETTVETTVVTEPEETEMPTTVPTETEEPTETTEAPTEEPVETTEEPTEESSEPEESTEPEETEATEETTEETIEILAAEEDILPPEGVPIDEEHFPDDVFRDYVASNCDSVDADGYLSDYEVRIHTMLKVNGLGIASLQGIEYFTSLTRLYCYENNLTSLDVSRNPLLVEVDCRNNNLKTLDLSSNTALTKLSCGNNNLTFLDISNNSALTSLTCFDNSLTFLDVTHNPELTFLDCDKNSLSSLDVSNNPALITLTCGYNNLTTLDVSNNPVLNRLYCGLCNLETLNLSGATALTNLDCISNNLTSLDVSSNMALTYLRCIENNITSLDVSNHTALTELICYKNELTSLDVSGATALTKLECYENSLTTLDVSGNPALTELDCRKNRLTALNLSGAAALASLDCYENKLSELDISSNSALTFLQCGYNSIASLDVSNNPALETLICYNNDMTSLNLSGAAALSSVNCMDNSLTTLDASSNSALTSLNCYGNRIRDLDVSNCSLLEYLECAKNQLTSLDVTNNPALTKLYCYLNHLTRLDVSNCTKLETLDCRFNSRDITVDTGNTFDLSTLPGFDVTKASNWVGGTVEGTVLTATADTVTYDYDVDGDTGDKTANFTLTTTLNLGIPIDEEHFPDAIFRAYVAENFDTNQNGYLFGDEITGATAIDVNGQGITSLAGIEYLTALTYLDCSYNYALTELDVSHNTALTKLNCMCSSLTTLDVSQNTALAYLDCSHQIDSCLATLNVSGAIALTYLACNDNALSALDISRNSALRTLYCMNNNLITLDVSNNSALTKLLCYSNPDLISLDVSGATALVQLGCNHSGLSSLDVSNNPVLNRLDCESCRLEALDVSHNPALTWLTCWGNNITTLDVSNNPELTWFQCSENQLTSLDVSVCTKIETFGCSDNKYVIILDANNTFDLSTLPGFDVARASNWAGGTVEGTVLTATANTVTYDYDVDGDTGSRMATFTLTTVLHEKILLTLDREAIALKKDGDPGTVQATVVPEQWGQQLSWRVENEAYGAEVVSIEPGDDLTCIVTPLNIGTAWLVAEIEGKENIYTARCQIEVTEKTIEDLITEVKLGVDNVIVELYQTNYAPIPIFMDLYPFGSDNEAPPSDYPIVTEARLEGKAAEYFELVVKDNGCLLVVPKDEAIANPPAVLGSYPNTHVIVKVGTKDFDAGIIRLNIKKTTPKLKATALNFDSFITGQSLPVTITGGNATIIGLDGDKDPAKVKPNWIDLNGQELRLNDEVGSKTQSGNVDLWTEVEGYTTAKKWPVSVSVKATYTQPKAALSASGVTVYKFAEHAAPVELELVSREQGETFDDLRVENVTVDQAFAGRYDLTYEDGLITLASLTDLAKAETIQLNVAFSGTDQELSLKLKVTPADVVPKLVKTSLTLNPAVTYNTAVGLTFTPASFRPDDLTYEVTRVHNKQTVVVNEELNVSFDAENNILNVATVKGATLPGTTYTVTIITGGKTVKLTVKTLAPDKKTGLVNITSTLKAIGTIDLSFPDSEIVIMPTFKNYLVQGCEDFDWEIKTKLGEDAGELFDVTIDADGTAHVKAASLTADQLNTQYSFYLITRINGKDEAVTAELAKLSLKRTTLAAKLSKTSISLNAAYMDETSVKLTSGTKNFEITNPHIKYPAELDVSYTGGELTVKIIPGITQPGQTYKITVIPDKDLGGKAATLTVTTPKAGKTSNVAAKVQVSGSIDVVRLDTFATVTPSLSNFQGEADYRIEVVDAKTLAPVSGFRIVPQEDGTFRIFADGNVNYSRKYKISITGILRDVNGETVATAPVYGNLTVRMGSVKLTADKKAVTLYAKDRYSSENVCLTKADTTLNGIEAVTIRKSKGSEAFTVRKWGEGKYAVCFADNVTPDQLPAKSIRLTLEVTLKGNNTGKPNTTIPVAVNVLK